MSLFRVDSETNYSHFIDPYEMSIMLWRQLEYYMNHPHVGSDMEWLPWLATSDKCYRAWRRSVGYGRRYRADTFEEELLDMIISTRCISWGVKFAFWAKRLQMDCVTRPRVRNMYTLCTNLVNIMFTMCQNIVNILHIICKNLVNML